MREIIILLFILCMLKFLCSAPEQPKSKAYTPVRVKNKAILDTNGDTITVIPVTYYPK